jgi:ABC-2 type transport system permease protein
MYSLRSYGATLAIGVKQEIAYKAALLIGFLVGLIWPFVLIALWFAVFHYSNSASISGYTVSSIAAYYLISGGLLSFMNSDLTQNLASSITDGTVARYLTRPMGIMTQVLLIGLPDVLVMVITRTLPMIIIAIVIFSISFNMQTLLLFCAFALIGFAVIQLISLMISASAIYFTQTYGLFYLFGGFSGLLGGSFIPLNLLPHWAAQLTGMLPFQFAYYIPLSIINGTLTASQAAATLPLAAFWLAVLAVISYLQWMHTRSRIDAVGV